MKQDRSSFLRVELGWSAGQIAVTTNATDAQQLILMQVNEAVTVLSMLQKPLAKVGLSFCFTPSEFDCSHHCGNT